MSQLYEYYNTGDDNACSIGGDPTEYRNAQTFTVGAAGHTIKSVKLKLYRIGTPGLMTVSIRTTSGGKPTSTVLTSGTIDADTLTTDSAGAWYEIPVTEYTLNASTMYAIVCRCPDAGSGEYVQWRADTTSPAYSDGQVWYTTDEVTWTSAPYDCMFENWGEPLGGANPRSRACIIG